MKSADELFQEYQAGSGTTRGESMKEFAAIIAARDEEMRQEWEKENRAWCGANNMPVDKGLVERMRSVGKRPAFRKGQIVWDEAESDLTYMVSDGNGFGSRRVMWSDLCDADGNTIAYVCAQPRGRTIEIDGNDNVFLKAVMG